MNELEIGELYKLKEAKLAYMVNSAIVESPSFVIKENEIIMLATMGNGGRFTFLYNTKLIHFYTLVLRFSDWLEKIS